MAPFAFVLLVASASLLLATSRAAPQSTNATLGIRIPEQCKGKGFCSIKPDGYDDIETKINNLLPKNMININSSPGGSIEQRSDDEDNCPSTKSFQSVYIYENPSGTTVDIIVQTKLFPQTVAMVTCKHTENDLNEDGTQCFKNLGLHMIGYKSRCQETKANRTLLIYDPDVNILKTKSYLVPVCCSCHVTKD